MKNNSLWIVLHKMRTPFIVIIITYTIAIIGLLLIDGIDANGKPYQMSIFDAFYFISYTATTIGFGETPYSFTYPQRLWVTFSIYLTVIGWFYGVGSLVSLLQNKTFVSEIEKFKFKASLNSIRTKFIIILGYNHITSEIIKKSLDAGIRAVVIEKDEDKANELILESFTPNVPVLVADVSNSNVLEYAGIKYKNCKAVVSLFEEDSLNLRVAITSKVLNKNVTLAIKSTTKTQVENLLDVEVEVVENSFAIIANQLNLAITSPNLFKLEKWIYKIDNLSSPLPNLPIGRYIVCGYGRMGKNIYEAFKNSTTIDLQFIEIDKNKLENLSEDEIKKIKIADADDKVLLESLDIKNTQGILAFTNDDTTNLSILTTAKKVNPSIITIAREDEIDDNSIFAHANIDFIFVPSKILINKTTNALFNPLCDIFLREIYNQDDNWAQLLTKDMIGRINFNPLTFELKIDQKNALMIFNELSNGSIVKLDVLSTSLYNRFEHNNLIVLLLYRNKEVTLLPSNDIELKIGDEILFAGDENAIRDIEYIAQNVYEFEYAYSGKEKNSILKIFNKDK